MFDKIKLGKGNPAKGKFLISEPFMYDPNFKRTVILLTEHTDQGTLGFILNRPIDMKIGESIEDFPNFDAPVYLGGPVQPDTLHYIHRVGDLLDDSEEILPGVFWGGNFEALKILIKNKQVDSTDFRFFVGYSGWSPDQLADELDEESWILAVASEESIFEFNTKSLWKQVLTEMGKEYGMLANFPEDPSLN